MSKQFSDTKDKQMVDDLNEQIDFEKDNLHSLKQKIKDETDKLEELSDLKDVVDTVKNTIHKQNKSLDENLQLLQNKNSADQQKIYYQQLQTEYLVIINFYLFYLYMILALIWGYFWFFVRDSEMSRFMSWFWYLHVFLYPYIAIYLEFFLYVVGRFVFSWFNGNPYYPWNNYTSYPPIV